MQQHLYKLSKGVQQCDMFSVLQFIGLVQLMLKEAKGEDFKEIDCKYASGLTKLHTKKECDDT